MATDRNAYLRRKTRRGLVALAHLGLAAAAWTLAYLTRLAPLDDPELVGELQATVLLAMATALFPLWTFRIFYGLLGYVGLRDMLAIARATVLSALLQTSVIIFMLGHGFSRVVLALYPVYLFILLAGSRLALRMLREKVRRSTVEPDAVRRTVVVGAGDTADLLLGELERSLTVNLKVVGLVDDDPHKIGGVLRNVRIHGPIARLPEITRLLNADLIVLAMPTAVGPALVRVVRLCEEAGVPFRRVPVLGQLLESKANVLQLREVAPGELLSRPPRELDRARIEAAVRGKRVLITGAAGSIGAELVRQVAPAGPAELILLDRAESPLAQMLIDVQRGFPGVKVRPILADITQPDRIRRWFAETRPQIVYHAAAYKHVPLMEDFPVEAVLNNVVGTAVVAEAAEATGAERFILISTDKAVRPESVMGRTKRLAEAVVLGRSESATLFVVVRFGNVLESSGSVVQLFKSQIHGNEALTLTDAEATRYFILPSEAAQLVIHAGALAVRPEVFLLDMGDPVRIGEMAENLVRLSGRRVEQDVPIRTVGLRPGERLHEPLVDEATESTAPSEQPGIFRVSVNGAGELHRDPRLAALLRELPTLDRDEAFRRLAALTDK